MQLNSIRPISPHLTIYKPQISSVLSISHRISGMILFFGIIFFVWWFMCINWNVMSIKCDALFTNWFGQIILISWSYALFFHLSTGIRHLFWDCGIGFSIKAMNTSGWFAFIMSLIMTSVSWLIIYIGI